MMLDDVHSLFLFCVFGTGLWWMYTKGRDKGYDEGYYDACYDVKTGRVDVEIKEEE